jgi:hypothetical protein
MEKQKFVLGTDSCDPKDWEVPQFAAFRMKVKKADSLIQSKTQSLRTRKPVESWCKTKGLRTRGLMVTDWSKSKGSGTRNTNVLGQGEMDIPFQRVNSTCLYRFGTFQPSTDWMMATYTGKGNLYSFYNSNANLFWKLSPYHQNLFLFHTPQVRISSCMASW